MNSEKDQLTEGEYVGLMMKRMVSLSNNGIKETEMDRAQQKRVLRSEKHFSF